MSVVANVAINVDSSGAVSKLRQVQQGAQATSQAVDKLNATTAATNDKFKVAANGIKYFTDAAGRARAENGRFLTIAERAAAGIKLQGDAAQRAANQLGGFRGAVGGLRGALASIGAGALVVGMVRGAAAAEQLQLRLKLLSREYGETERVQQFVAQSAKTFGQSQVEAAAGVADVFARLRPLGTSLSQIETVYKGFNAVALASGTSAAEASGAFLQLSQALGSGRLQGDEFRSIAEQVPGILRLVANEMGVTVGQLKQLGSEGKITSDILINALAKGFEENKDKIAELLALSPAQKFKEFKDSTQALSNAIGSELLPAIVPVVKVATELLNAFGQLPGPMKTIIAVAIGLTAAFVALAPAISATIGLLGGLSLATLAAAGPWIALAAGVTAAAVALAGYRTESQKIGAKAAAGDPAALAAARNRMVNKQQEVDLLEAQRPSPRSAKGGDLARARGELAQLKRDVATGETVSATPATLDTTTLDTTTPGTGSGTGASSAASDANRAADEAQRVAEQMQQQLKAADDINFALKNRLAIAQETESVAKRMVEFDVRKNEIAKEFDELKEAAKGADELTLINANQIIEQRIAQIKYEEEINELLTQRAILMADVVRQAGMPTVYNELKEQDAALQAVLDKYPAIGAAADAAATMATSGIAAMIAGTKSAEQVFVEFLNAIADALINTAKQMIAQYIAIGIAKMFAGIGAPGGFAPSGPLAAVGNINPLPTSFTPRANGGPVASGTPYLVGERGPELFMPGTGGSVVSNSNLRSAMGAAPGGSGGGTVLNMSFQSTTINGTEYVSRDQLEAAMAATRRQAAKEGASRGMNMTLDKIQNSPSTRSRVGIR